MEKLEYIIEDSTIAEILGVQNFTNEASAVLELVKNAFDAQADEVTITINDEEMIVEDTGNGMNREAILENWMHVGRSGKDYKIGEGEKTRVLAGSKGVGRFALARLGREVELYSKMRNELSVVWKTDWSTSSLDVGDKHNVGTRIVIKNLRDNWTDRRVRDLRYFLSRTYNDSVMKIWIVYKGNREEVRKYFGEFSLGIHGVSLIRLQYHADEMQLDCNIESDEFKESVNQICPDINLKKVVISLEMLKELEGYQEDWGQQELSVLLQELGDFEAELFFSLKSPSAADAEKFQYKYRFLDERYDSGVILYRNSFSISSYEGKKDWLEFGKRSRLSPAAATHPTGSWRVRENQISGKVIIDKEINKNLLDMSNRQGLLENDSYQLFVKIIISGIQCFERYRQSIIRSIVNKKSEKKIPAKSKIMEEVLKTPQKLDELSTEEKTEFLSEIESIRNEYSESNRQMVEKEERFRYDIRLLNRFATSGLKAISIAHDMHNKRNSLEKNVNYIISALRRYECWDALNEENNTKYIYRNVPGLLEKNERLNRKVVNFMEVMLSETEKEQFQQEDINILSLMQEIKRVWEKDYAWIEIQLDIEENLEYTSAKDVFGVIFDNLILNSVQQNDKKNSLQISISIRRQDKNLLVTYADNGIGLAPKYQLDPMRIVEVHETTRANGHGVGMWIVHNTIVNTHGEIISIEGSNGFKIRFILGDKI